MENLETVLDGVATMTTNSALLTAEQAAQILDVSAGTLSVWRATKRYALRYVKVGSKVRYRRDDLERFISLRTQSGVGEQSRRRHAK